MDKTEAERILAALKSGTPLVGRHKSAEALKWSIAELAAANEARDALRAEVERLRALMARILEEPSNTMSDAKALREIIRMVKAQTAIVAARKGA